MSGPGAVGDRTWSAGRWRTAAELIAATPGPVRVPGTIVPGLRDHHVHLGLVDRAAVAESALSSVDDLGWSLDEALAWRRTGLGGCAVRVAGPFLTAPGGYPAGRSWAPEPAVRALTSPADGVHAVRALARAGVDVIKVVLHTGLPLLDDVTLAAVVGTAHAHGRPVAAHVEGSGQSARAAAAGVDVLAHTPWTETLPDDLLQAMVPTTAWISTLAIHGRDSAAYTRAIDNLSRFAARGGRVRYGTDLGNGPAAPGLHAEEIRSLVDAGLSTSAIMDAIARGERRSATEVTWTAEPPPDREEELPAWLATLRRRTVADLASRP